MYRLISSICLKDDLWAYQDVSGLTCQELLNSYDDVSLNIVEDSVEPNAAYTAKLDVLKDYLSLESNRFVSVSSAMQRLTVGLYTLESDHLDFSATHHIKYHDLFDLGLTVERGSLDFGYGNDVPNGLFSDIRLRLNDTSKITQHSLENKTLFTVDGLIRAHNSSNGDTFIRDISKSLTPTSTFGVVDFSQMEGVDIFKIGVDNTKLKVRTMGENRTYRTDFSVTLPMDITNKTIMLVSGGYIHFNDTSYYKFSENVVIVEVLHSLAIKRLMRRPRVERATYCNFEADLSSLSRSQFTAEKYLTAGDSFLIVFDNNDIVRYRTHLNPTGIMGAYDCSRIPTGIVTFEDGRIAEYRVTEINAVTNTSVVRTAPAEVSHDLGDLISPHDYSFAVHNGLDQSDHKPQNAYLNDFYYIK